MINISKKLYCLIIIFTLSFYSVTEAFSLDLGIKTNGIQAKGVQSEIGITEGKDTELITLADNSTAADISQPVKHYMEWTFVTYAEPDFNAKKTGTYSPQYITVTEVNTNGWGCVEIGGESHWVYLKKNLRRTEKYMALYENKEDTKPVDIIHPQLVEIIEQEGNWVKINTWLGFKWMNLNSVSPRVLLDVPILNQRALGYPTGCEIVSLCMMINYVTEAEIDTLISEVPRAYDPHFGFRGDPSTTGGFTVFPPALFGIAEKYLGSVVDLSGGTLDDLKDKLSSGVPIVVWIAGLGFNVHAFCLTGYDEKGFYYNDPWSGKKDRFITYSSFNNVWNSPIYDSRMIEYPSGWALSYNPARIKKQAENNAEGSNGYEN